MSLKPLPFAVLLSAIFALVGMYSGVSSDTLFIAEALIWSAYFVVTGYKRHDF